MKTGLYRIALSSTLAIACFCGTNPATAGELDAIETDLKSYLSTEAALVKKIRQAVERAKGPRDAALIVIGLARDLPACSRAFTAKHGHKWLKAAGNDPDVAAMDLRCKREFDEIDFHLGKIHARMEWWQITDPSCSELVDEAIEAMAAATRETAGEKSIDPRDAVRARNTYLAGATKILDAYGPRFHEGTRIDHCSDMLQAFNKEIDACRAAAIGIEGYETMSRRQRAAARALIPWNDIPCQEALVRFKSAVEGSIAADPGKGYMLRMPLLRSVWKIEKYLKK